MSSLSNIARTTLVTFITTAVILLLLAFRMVSPFILPILMGAILSILLRGVYRRLCGEKKRRGRAALAITVGVLIVILLPLGVFATMGVHQGIAVGKTLSETGVSYQGLTDKISHWGVPLSLGLEPAEIESRLQEWTKTLGQFLLTAAVGIASHLPSLAFDLILMALSCYFFLVDGEKFSAWAGDKIPLDQSVRHRLSKSFQDTSVAVVWATLAASGAQSFVIALLFISLGIPCVILAAGATFLLAWIPMVGSSPVWILGAIYLLVNGSIAKMIILIGIGLSLGILDNFVRTLVLKGRSAMHPLVSLVAIFGGIEMFGIMGVFLGPIIVAVLISVLEVWPELGRRLGLLETPTRPVPGTTSLSTEISR